MVAKLNAFLRVVGHTLLSFIAVLVCGFTFYACFRPIVGPERYAQLSQSPIMVGLFLIVVALWGLVLYERWHDNRAFFAWVLPALWTCHLVLSGGPAAPNKWADSLFLLEVGGAYSVGAAIAAIVLRRAAQGAPSDQK